MADPQPRPSRVRPRRGAGARTAASRSAGAVREGTTRKPARPPRAGATTLVLGCGALATELLELVRVNGLDHVEVRCLPAALHNLPMEIPAAVDTALGELKDGYEQVFLAYADCGTAGRLDEVLARHGVERLPGAHCYAFFAGLPEWQAIHDENPGTFYLTDFLARSFESLVVRGLGLDERPDLRELYFANYTRLVYLAQREDPILLERARAAAATLGVTFEHRVTGYGELATAIGRLGRPAS